jgi:hypothetical protein
MKLEIADSDALSRAERRYAMGDSLHASVTPVRAQTLPDVSDVKLNGVCCRPVIPVEAVIALDKIDKPTREFVVFTGKASSLSLQALFVISARLGGLGGPDDRRPLNEGSCLAARPKLPPRCSTLLGLDFGLGKGLVTPRAVLSEKLLGRSLERDRAVWAVQPDFG